MTSFLKFTNVVIIILLTACNQIKSSNHKVPELDTITFSELSRKAYDYLYARQDECDSMYHIGQFEHWFYDQTTGKLTFSNKDTIKLVINYEEVGSISLKSNTWLWSWNNSSIEPKVKSDITNVQDYGDKRDFKKLRDAKWNADLYDGWEMTAISAYLLKAKGAYRVPINDSSLYSFMIFKNIRVTDSLLTKEEYTRNQ